MSCREFERFIDDPGGEAAWASHARGCDPCRRRLEVVTALRSLPPVEVPGGLDERVLGAARASRPRMLPPALLRTAAALAILVTGLATWFLLRPGEEAWRPRNLEVVDVGRNGVAEEDLMLEEVYGPATPIRTGTGGGPDASRPR